MWYINGLSYKIEERNKQQVLLDTCTQQGYDIPRFCYHEQLKIAGNCRMCLIEDSKSPKPVISCAATVNVDLNIFTNTVRVKRARESTMEFLLINHPLDCPICDQGGECDLQDLALIYGADHGRFYDYKKNVEDKNCGPIVKTSMNRCILCTRCVRFASDVAGFTSFGLTGRGNKMEIGSYIEKIVDTDLSGNLIDVCPVGALTSKPYAFMSRPWELKKHAFFSFFNDQPQLLRVDIKENEIVRILPSKNNALLNRWITNKTRYSYEGITRSRIYMPEVSGILVSWEGFISVFRNMLAFSVCKKISIFKNNFIAFFIANSNKLVAGYKATLAIKNWLCCTASAGYKRGFFNDVLLTRTDKNLMELSSLNSVFIIALNLQYDAPVLSIALNSWNASTVNLEGKRHQIFTWFAILSPTLMVAELSLGSDLSCLCNFLQIKLWFNALVNYFYIICTAELKSTLSAILEYTVGCNRFKLLVTTMNIRMNFIWDDVGLSGVMSLLTTNTVDLSFLKYSTFSNDLSSNNTINNMLHLSHVAVLDNKISSFTVPNKTAFEVSDWFYNTDYSSFKTTLVVTASKYARAIKAWFLFLLHTIGNTVEFSFSPNVLNANTAFYLFTNKLRRSCTSMRSFFSINTNKSFKLTTLTQYHRDESLTHFSPTLALVQLDYSLNTNLYSY